MKKSIILVGMILLSFVFMASVSAAYKQTIVKELECGGFPPHAYDTVFEFSQTPRPSGDGTLTVSVRGDYNWEGAEDIDVIVEGTSLGKWLPGEQCSSGLLTKTYTVTKNQLVQWSVDGKIQVTLDQGGM